MTYPLHGIYIDGRLASCAPVSDQSRNRPLHLVLHQLVIRSLEALQPGIEKATAVKTDQTHALRKAAGITVQNMI